MSHAPNNIEVKLTIHYYGLKATQYFSKTSPESENVFLDDLLALKLPLPKRGNTALISYGRMQCIWPSVQKHGLLHKQIKMRIEPTVDFRATAQEQHSELSIANITAKFRDLRSSKIDHLSFKRSFKDLEDPSQDERPLKKKKFEQGPMDTSSGTTSPTKHTQNSIFPKSAVDTASKPPLAPKVMPDWWTPAHQHSHSIDSTSRSQDDTTPSRKYSAPDERIGSNTTRAASEFLNNMDISKGFPNREDTSRWVKQETSDQLKAPPFSAPAAIQSSTALPMNPTTSNASTSTNIPLRLITTPSSLPARPDANPPPLPASSGDSPVRKLSRFGPAPAPAIRYSPHTLAAFAKEYTKIERISPPPFDRAPSPPPPAHVPMPPPLSTTSSSSRLADVAPPISASSGDSTFSSLKSTAIAAVSPNSFKPFKLVLRDHPRGPGEKLARGMGGRAEAGPTARDHPMGTATPSASDRIAATDAREGKLKTMVTPRTGSGTGDVRDVEMREPRRVAPPSTSFGSVQNGRQPSSGSGSGGTSASARDESALVELRQRLAKMEAELAEERRRRQVAEDAIADIRRECRAPFVVPSLLDAFMELSRMTTIATTTNPGSLVPQPSSNISNSKHPPQNTTTNTVVLNGSATGHRPLNVSSAGRPLPPPRSADSHAMQKSIRTNGQWPGSANLPPPVFSKTSNAQASAPVRVKEEPVEITWG